MSLHVVTVQRLLKENLQVPSLLGLLGTRGGVTQTQLESGYMLPQKEVEEWACHLKGVYLEKWKKDLGRGILPKDPLQNLPSIPVQHINSTGPSLGLFTHCKI